MTCDLRQLCVRAGSLAARRGAAPWRLRASEGGADLHVPHVPAPAAHHGCRFTPLLRHVHSVRPQLGSSGALPPAKSFFQGRRSSGSMDTPRPARETQAVNAVPPNNKDAANIAHAELATQDVDHDWTILGPEAEPGNAEHGAPQVAAASNASRTL
eukprot:3771421-Pleurochrysis_carterae.AAC.1